MLDMQFKNGSNHRFVKMNHIFDCCTVSLYSEPQHLTMFGWNPVCKPDLVDRKTILYDIQRYNLPASELK